MNTVVDFCKERAKAMERKREQLTLQIQSAMRGHEDEHIVQNMLEEYGPQTMMPILKKEYGLTFV